jgi:hypothetical protein
MNSGMFFAKKSLFFRINELEFSWFSFCDKMDFTLEQKPFMVESYFRNDNDHNVLDKAWFHLLEQNLVILRI